MRFKTKALCIVLTAIISLSACQPTPEEEAVSNKGDDAFEERVAQTAPPSAEIFTPQAADSTEEEIRSCGI